LTWTPYLKFSELGRLAEKRYLSCLASLTFFEAGISFDKISRLYTPEAMGIGRLRGASEEHKTETGVSAPAMTSSSARSKPASS
jgi:hypothetical protein